MLKNAMLACGAMQLSLLRPDASEDQALFYHNAADEQLAPTTQAMKDSGQDLSICVATGVICNIFDVMSMKPLSRMNEISKCRTFFTKLGIDANAKGLAGACFWVHVAMEVLSNLALKWQLSWKPDDWGIDTNFQPETEDNREIFWAHRMLYVMGKISDFCHDPVWVRDGGRQNSGSRAPQLDFHQRQSDWHHLLGLIQRWHDCIPPTMHPLSILGAGQTSRNSTFPEVYLGAKRSTTVARLLYHTGMILLAQSNPHEGESHEMIKMQHEHSVMVCGIAGTTKDR
jgi:hypothetical protein